MGGGSSRGQGVEESAPSLSTLSPPSKRDGNVALFTIVPVEDDLRRRGTTLLLEVGPEGFRLLRPVTEDPISLFPWGQIHSWAHGPSKFTFRYFDDGKRTIMLHNVDMRDVDELLEHIQSIIDVILAERKKSAIPSEAFEALVQVVSGCSEAAKQLELINVASADFTFSSDQGRTLLELLPTTFDQIEAAIVLHGKLIDQNRFSYMLEALDCQTDRDNVWHRITLLKKNHSIALKGNGITR